MTTNDEVICIVVSASVALLTSTFIVWIRHKYDAIDRKQRDVRTLREYQKGKNG